MVERYNDDIVFTGQVAALVIGVSTTADEEAATMQPDHDGALAAVVYMRRPYIQHQTVFADRQVGKGQDCFHFAPHVDGRLRTYVAHFVRRLPPGPGGRLLRRQKAILAAGIRSIVNTEERIDALRCLTQKLAFRDRKSVV